MHATLADVIADTVQNAIEAGAQHITLRLSENGRTIAVAIEDDGKGMDAATCARAFDPFYTEAGKHDKRKVGLGLPILRQICQATGGDVSLASEKGRGTTLRYHFDAGHIDLPPMGDLSATIVMLFNYPGTFECVFTHEKAGRSYSIARSELSEAVGGFTSADGFLLAQSFIASQEEDLAQTGETAS